MPRPVNIDGGRAMRGLDGSIQKHPGHACVEAKAIHSVMNDDSAARGFRQMPMMLLAEVDRSDDEGFVERQHEHVRRNVP